MWWTLKEKEERKGKNKEKNTSNQLLRETLYHKTKQNTQKTTQPQYLQPYTQKITLCLNLQPCYLYLYHPIPGTVAKLTGLKEEENFHLIAEDEALSQHIPKLHSWQSLPSSGELSPLLQSFWKHSWLQDWGEDILGGDSYGSKTQPRAEVWLVREDGRGGPYYSQSSGALSEEGGLAQVHGVEGHHHLKCISWLQDQRNKKERNIISALQNSQNKKENL